MGSKSSKYSPRAPGKTVGKLPGLKILSEPCKNIYYGGQGDDEVEWSNSKIDLLKPVPLHEYCPHCNRVVRTSAEIEAELKRFIKEAKKQFKKEWYVSDKVDNTKPKVNRFAGIKKIPRPIADLEQRENDDTERILTQRIPEVKTIPDDKEEGIYDEVTVDPISVDLIPLELSNPYAAEDDEYQTPRSLQLPDDMWRF